MPNISIEDYVATDPSYYNWYFFDYPINCLKQKTNGWIIRTVPGSIQIENEIDLLNTKNFDKVFYYYEDDYTWEFIAKHKNGYYLSLESGCNEDESEQGVLYYEKDPYLMYKFCISDKLKRKLNYENDIEYADNIGTEQDNLTIEDFHWNPPQQYNWAEFEYPIASFLGEDGSWTLSATFGKNYPVPNKEMLLDNQQFEKVYHFKEGHNDDDAWEFIVKHKNGFYIMFDASCDYTGFDCRGGGMIIYDDDPKSFYNFGLTEEFRNCLKHIHTSQGLVGNYKQPEPGKLEVVAEKPIEVIECPECENSPYNTNDYDSDEEDCEEATLEHHHGKCIIV